MLTSLLFFIRPLLKQTHQSLGRYNLLRGSHANLLLVKMSINPLSIHSLLTIYMIISQCTEKYASTKHTNQPSQYTETIFYHH